MFLGPGRRAELGGAAFKVAHSRSGDREEEGASRSSCTYLSAAGLNGARVLLGLDRGTDGAGRVGVLLGCAPAALAGVAAAASRSPRARRGVGLAGSRVGRSVRCSGCAGQGRAYAADLDDELVAVLRGTLVSRPLVFISPDALNMTSVGPACWWQHFRNRLWRSRPTGASHREQWRGLGRQNGAGAIEDIVSNTLNERRARFGWPVQ